jgi:TolA-binding protein
MHHAGEKPEQDLVPPASVSELESAEHKTLSLQAKGEGLKGSGGRVSEVTSQEAATPMRKPKTDRSASAKPQIDPVRNVSKPWERPLEVPSSARGKTSNTKGAGSSKDSPERPIETLPPATPSKSRTESQEQPILAVNPPALDSGPAVISSAEPAPISSSPVPGGTNATDSSADRIAADQKPLPEGQKGEQNLEEKNKPSPGLKSSKSPVELVSGAPREAANVTDQPQESLNSGQPQAAAIAGAADSQVVNGQIEVNQVSKPASKVLAGAPKKLSEAERREEIRKQATESYRSGQQLIRESRNTEAMQAFKQSVKLMPGSADAWLRIAFLLEREGNLEEARRAFREAKKLWSF